MTTKHTHPLRAELKLGLISVILTGLAACGGGGDGGSSPRASIGSGELITTSASVDASNANQCAAPRAGTAEQPGTLNNEKAWVRALMDKTYLWYKEVPNVNAANFTAASSGSNYLALDDYFQALKTPRLINTRRVDQFSFTVSTTQLTNQQGGVSSGYGMRLAAFNTSVPRDYRVLYVEKGSPAQQAGVLRGDKIISIDGVSIDSDDIATLNSGLSPVAGKTTVFGMRAPSGTTRDVTVASSTNIVVNPVAQTETFSVSTPAGTKTVGYLVLNSFNITSAEAQLVKAINQLKAANVTELVLDLRYNGGGFLGISSQLAWMIGGDPLKGKVFERTICNDKNPFSFCNQADEFQQTSLGFSVPAGQSLPTLGLKRVFVLTTRSTCSASESVINSLDPFLDVVQIGNTTCGKPYGFLFLSNCGTSYAAMHFKGENAIGFGDYADGLLVKKNCRANDDLSKQRGDASEGMLSTALSYVQNNACPAPISSQKIASRSAESAAAPADFQILRSPLEEQRWYRMQP